MGTRDSRKDFDCIEMKLEIQQKMWERFQKSKSQYKDFSEFLEKESSTWVDEEIERIRKSEKSA